MMAEAEVLVGLYDERVEMTRALAAHPRPTGAMAELVMAKGAELNAACEVFRRKHFPRRHRIVAAGSSVFTVSVTGRTTTIFDRADA